MRRPPVITLGVVALLLLSACTGAPRPSGSAGRFGGSPAGRSLAGQFPERALTDLVVPGSPYPRFVAVLGEDQPVRAAEAYVALHTFAANRAVAVEPELVRLFAPSGGWRLMVPDDRDAAWKLTDAAAIAEAVVTIDAAGTRTVLEAALPLVAPGLRTGQLSALDGVRRLLVVAHEVGSPVERELASALRDALGHGCARLLAGAHSAEVGPALVTLSGTLAAAAAARATCQLSHSDRSVLAMMASEEGLASALDSAQTMDVVNAVAGLIDLRRLAREGPPRALVASSLSVLTADDDSGETICPVSSLQFAAIISAHSGIPASISDEWSECLVRQVLWRGRIPDAVSTYDVLSTVYGISALDVLGRLTGGGAMDVADRLRSGVAAADADSAYARVALGLAFNPATIREADLAEVARSTLDSRIPIHIGMLAAATTRAGRCPDSVRDALAQHIKRVASELGEAISSSHLPYLYWAVVLAVNTRQCLGSDSTAATVTSTAKEFLEGNGRDSAGLFHFGAEPPDPLSTRYGWDALCLLGAGGMAEQAATVADALSRWMPTSLDQFIAGDPSVLRAYSLLRLADIAADGCGTTWIQP